MIRMQKDSRAETSGSDSNSEGPNIQSLTEGMEVEDGILLVQC